MSYYDVFNGDGDGICALHQLRLAEPRGSILVTGLKRDIELLQRVRAVPGDQVTVLDISMDRNRAPLLALLRRGVEVRYIDHHFAGEIPLSPELDATIDESPGVCTSLLVDRLLDGRFRKWAVVGAFADNLQGTAMELAKPLALDERALADLRELGESLNYNAYGETEADLLLPPAQLYRIVSRYEDPLKLAREEPLVTRLTHERETDMRRAFRARPSHQWRFGDVYVLPDAAWSRRVSGTFANRLATKSPASAHAVLTPVGPSHFSVSVRAPVEGGPSAVEFCRRFPNGGGRSGAAGIDRLDAARLAEFVTAFEETWGRSREEVAS